MCELCGVELYLLSGSCVVWALELHLADIGDFHGEGLSWLGPWGHLHLEHGHQGAPRRVGGTEN